MEDDVDRAIYEFSASTGTDKKRRINRISHLIIGKDVFERIGYGFGSQQYLNILLYLSGASLFLIGIINGIKSLLSVIFASFLQDISEGYEQSKSGLVVSGVVLSVSFFAMALAIYFRSVPVFAAGIIISTISVVFYGDIYAKLTKRIIRLERVPFFLRRMSHIGLLVSAVSLYLAAIILEKKDSGYLLVLGISSITLLISVIFVIFLPREPDAIQQSRSMWVQFKAYYRLAFANARRFMGNWVFFIIILTGTVSGAVQAIGNTYYGIFIYNYLGGWGYGRYMNVGLVFVLALLTSLLAPHICRRNARAYGKFPMLVFGTLLMAILPLTMVYNPHLPTVAVAVVLGVVGSSITGIARGLLAIEYLPEPDRKSFFVVSGVITTIPYFLIFPVGSFLAQQFGLKLLFKMLGFSLTFFVVPLYFLVVLLHHRKRVKI